MKNQSNRRAEDVTDRSIIGLGATPGDMCGGDMSSSAALTAVTSCGFTQVPVIEYTTRTIQLPLQDSAIESTFGAQIDLLNLPSPYPNGISVDSSFVGKSNTLQADMLAMGIGIHGFGEPLQFSLIGNAMTPLPAPGSPVWSPDAFTANDLANATLGPVTGILPACLEWGGADWNAIWHLMEGYQFVWTMNQRYDVIKEIAADVAYFGPYAEADAASDSEIVAQQYVRQVNNRYRDLSAGGIFVPVGARRMGSVTTGGVNTGVFHASRDFDLAGATWGGIRNQGGAACCNPFRKFSKPVLFERGIPIGMELREQDEYHASEMRRYMSLSESLGGSLAIVGIDTQVNGLSIAGANVGLELTLDQGANVTVAQRVNTDRVIFKGGVMKLAVLIKGVEVWGAWKQYLVGQAGLGRVSAPTITGQSGVSLMPGV